MATPKKTNKANESKNLEETKKLNPNEVVTKIGNLQVDILSTLSDVSAKVTENLELLKSTQDAIKVNQDRLKELYSIEEEAAHLEDIKNAFKEEELKYQELVSNNFKEYNLLLEDAKKKRQRDEEEYAYNLKQKIMMDENSFKAQIEERKRYEKNRQDELMKSWHDRETALNSKEEEFNSLKNKVVELQAATESEVKKAVAIAESKLKNDYEHKLDLLNKDRDSEAKLAQSRESALQIQVGQLVEQVDALNKQLAEARRDSKDIASAALQAASGQNLVDFARQTLDSKDNPKSK
jgi:hypothetical protein